MNDTERWLRDELLKLERDRDLWRQCAQDLGAEIFTARKALEAVVRGLR